MSRSVLKIFICLLLVSLNWKTAAADAISPYQVKAAFIYNFIKFVEWPTTTFNDSKSPYVVGVLGKDPFGLELDYAMKNKTVNGRPIVVRRITDEKMNQCHLLFISSSEKRRLKSIFEQLKDKPILTLGETEEFAQTGGMINFVIEENKVRFQINIEAAKRADLKIHSTLLNLARVVRK